MVITTARVYDTAVRAPARYLGAVFAVARVVARTAKTVMPRWMVPLFAVCLVIPGPVDELGLLVVLAVVLIRSAEHRATMLVAVAEAWQAR